MKHPKALAAAAAAVLFATGAPVVSRDMTYLASAEVVFPIDIPPTTLPDFDIAQALAMKAQLEAFGDSDGNGRIFAAAFRNSSGRIVYQEVTEGFYRSMATRNGRSLKPAKTERVSLLKATLVPEQAVAAIAHDNSTLNAFTGGTVASLTFAHTVNTNTDGLLIVCPFSDGGTDNTTGVTYAGNAMTNVDTQAGSAGVISAVSMWVQVTPTSGSNNVVISVSPNTRIAGIASNYTGVNQSTTPNIKTKGSATGESQTLSVTTTADNAWGIMCAINDSGAATAGAGTTVRQAGASGHALGDSNSAWTPPGAFSLTMNKSGAANWRGILAAWGQPSVSFAGQHDMIIFD